MTPGQRSALETLAGRMLNDPEVEAIDAHLETGNVAAIAWVLSVGRTRVFSRMTSARGLAELVGPLTAETIMLKLEGARDTMLASADQSQRVLGSLLRRQLAFLGGEGLDFGSAALRGMLDQFLSLGVLTVDEVSALKTIGVRPDPITWQQVAAALEGVQA